MDLKRMGSLVEYFRIDLIGGLLGIHIIHVQSAEFFGQLKANQFPTTP